MDGDGNADILWRRGTTGDIVNWWATTATQVTSTFSPLPPPTAHPESTGEIKKKGNFLHQFPKIIWI